MLSPDLIRNLAMPTDVFEFRMPVYRYQWVQVHLHADRADKQAKRGRPASTAEWMLIRDMSGGSAPRIYDPLHDSPALFRTLADVNGQDREAILAFANQYGELGLPAPHETHRNWLLEIAFLRRAVEMWDWLEAGNTQQLGRFLHWEAGSAPDAQTAEKLAGWYYQSHPDLPLDERWAHPPPGAFEQWIEPADSLLKEGDICLAARFLIQGWINRRLEGRVAPRLVYRMADGTQVMQIVPSQLIGALWLQFANAIAGNKEYRACKECGTWFEISSAGDARTARRQFCSDRCKSRDYRKRRQGSEQAHLKELAGDDEAPSALKRTRTNARRRARR
jgi:endogenous inhibitor of DNA gyrase (YacG/DUF329 family)